MEIILLEHVEKLGKMGDKVHVKNGYARNYLLPQNKSGILQIFDITGKEIYHQENITFDVSVVIEEQKGKQGDVKISVLSCVVAGGELGKKSTQQTTQRIQFSVPYLPAACTPPKEE